MSRSGDNTAVVFLDLGNTLIDYHSGGLTDDEKDFLGLRNMVRKSLVLVANSPIPGFCHDAALRKLGIFHYFSLRQYSYDAGVRKPNEKFFQLALRRARTDAIRGAMVGDSWSLDIEPALRLGMQTFWYRPNAIPEVEEGNPEHAAHVIRGLADIPALLR